MFKKKIILKRLIDEKLNFSQPGTSQERKQDMKGKDMHLLMMQNLMRKYFFSNLRIFFRT